MVQNEKSCVFYSRLPDTAYVIKTVSRIVERDTESYN